MMLRHFSVKPFFAVSILLTGLLIVPTRTSADPQTDKQNEMIAQLVCEYVKQGHLNKPEINDELSRRLFKRFLKELDPAKLYFMKSDVEEFKKQETVLDDQALKGDLSFAYKVYNRFVEPRRAPEVGGRVCSCQARFHRG